MPQMQALADRLSDRLAGATLEGFEPLGFAGLKTVVPPESLVGGTVATVGRRGKYLVFDFGGPRLLIHLSQAGRLDIEDPPKHTKPKGSVVRLRFTDPRLTDPTAGAGDLIGVLVREHGTERKAGWWVLAAGDDGPLEKLGPEPDSDEFAEFVRRSDDGRRIHTLLRDQRTVAGVGRGYADDALHRARLSPYATLKSLDGDERERLLDAVREVLADGLERERGRTGGLSEPKLGGHFVVHGKAGVPCPVCGDDLKRVSYESHEVVYCPRCQTGGKVLADRRLSRLIR
jgi:formamidopyrimidine-DNA glycosylase